MRSICFDPRVGTDTICFCLFCLFACFAFARLLSFASLCLSPLLEKSSKGFESTSRIDLNLRCQAEECVEKGAERWPTEHASADINSTR
jgi:hypothetical protein